MKCRSVRAVADPGRAGMPDRVMPRWRVLLAVAALYGAVSLTRFVDAYAGAPDQPKDCEPIAGAAATDDAGPALAEPSVRYALPALPSAFVRRAGTVNDASCLNRTHVFGVARPSNVRELREVLTFARQEGLQVTPSGARHSMGGQAFVPRGIVLDMRGMDDMAVDRDGGTLQVGAGATWERVLGHVHARGLSVSSMQGVDILTVGGSISVNAHGTDHRSGSIASTVRSLDIMLADGRVVRADRSHHRQLFRSAIGGYGLFGVIVSAELDLVPNDMYAFDQRLIAVDDFPAIYRDEIAPDDRARLAYVHLSTAPGSFMREAILYRYDAAGPGAGPPPPLGDIGWVRSSRFMLNLSKTGRVGQWAKWAGQKHVLPRFRPCLEQRSTALASSEACLFSRNQALHTSLDALRNKLPYLPYQLRYTPEQFHRAYPAGRTFFARKRLFDPAELFSNHLYERYGRT
jgi:FAD/FMN-containing dehydrogenase